MDDHAIRELERQRDMLLEERQMWRQTHMTLTDAEREAIEAAIRGYENEDGVYLPSDLNEPCLRIAATLRGLLERTK